MAGNEVENATNFVSKNIREIRRVVFADVHKSVTRV